MRTMYILRTDDRPTDLAFWKTLNGNISAMGHLLHFMFGSRVGFSSSMDRIALVPVGPNPRWLGEVRIAIPLQRVVGSTSCLVLGLTYGRK